MFTYIYDPNTNPPTHPDEPRSPAVASLPDPIFSKKKKFKCKTLVVGFEGGGASFAQKCFGLAEDADWIGTVVLPGAPSSRSTDATSTTGGLGDSLNPADPLNSACNIFLKRVGEGSGGADNNSGGDNSSGNDERSSSDGGGGGGTVETTGGGGGGDSSTPSPNPDATDSNREDGGVAVALCGYRVPPRQAGAWAKALLGAIDAEVVVVLATVAAEPGRSEGWPGARLVATAEAEEREDCLKVIEQGCHFFVVVVALVVPHWRRVLCSYPCVYLDYVEYAEAEFDALLWWVGSLWLFVSRS